MSSAISVSCSRYYGIFRQHPLLFNQSPVYQSTGPVGSDDARGPVFGWVYRSSIGTWSMYFGPKEADDSPTKLPRCVLFGDSSVSWTPSVEGRSARCDSPTAERFWDAPDVVCRPHNPPSSLVPAPCSHHARPQPAVVARTPARLSVLLSDDTARYPARGGDCLHDPPPPYDRRDDEDDLELRDAILASLAEPDPLPPLGGASSARPPPPRVVGGDAELVEALRRSEEERREDAALREAIRESVEVERRRIDAAAREVPPPAFIPADIVNFLNLPNYVYCVSEGGRGSGYYWQRPVLSRVAPLPPRRASLAGADPRICRDEWRSSDGRLEETLRNMGMRAVECGGGGACFYLSLVYQLIGGWDDSWGQALEIRRTVAAHIVRERGFYLEKFAVDEKFADGAAAETTFDAYVARLSAESTYTEGGLEFHAAAHSFNLRIHIYDGENGTIQIYEPSRTGGGGEQPSDIHIAHYSMHYRAVRRCCRCGHKPRCECRDWGLEAERWPDPERWPDSDSFRTRK